MEDPAWSVSKFVVGIDGGAQLEARRVYVHGAVGYGHPPLCSAAQSEGPGALILDGDYALREPEARRQRDVGEEDAKHVPLKTKTRCYTKMLLQGIIHHVCASLSVYEYE